jgi:FAD/FMN-containing dehydrogenase
VPKPEVQVTLRAAFARVEDAVSAVVEMIRARVVPAALEIIDADSLAAVVEHLQVPPLAPPGTGAVLLIECDGLAGTVAEEAVRVEEACRAAGAAEVLRARDAAERAELWRVRREISLSLRMLAPLKFNHDVVVPTSRVPELFALVDQLRRDYNLRIPLFGHIGDGNIHVNMMVHPDEETLARVRAAEQRLFEGVVALDGHISGEHGIGFSKAPFLPLELSLDLIALMKRVKTAFDPHGILNPGKIFP